MIKYRLFFLAILFSACGKNTVLKKTKLISHYPSASGIEQLKNKLYVIGDDANQMLILDEELNPVDSLQLYNFKENRIPKSTKADLESISISRDGKLLLLGSGSLAPYRNVAWLIDPITKQNDSLRLDSFFLNLSLNGVLETNIEGATAVPGNMILANRGNKGYPKNFLVVTSSEFWKKQSRAPISLIQVGVSSDTAIFNGISGMAYAPKTDRLILSVSTEDTRNSLEDGTIGKSYIWIIKNFSAKKRWKAINPDQMIDLEKLDAKFRGQKIESVCVLKETRNFLYIVLAADNDNGSSTLFKVIAEKE